MRAEQKIWLEAPEFGRRWPVTIDVGEIDPGRRWIDLRVSLPFGMVNREHITLTETEAGGTLVRFN
jgi:ligand-binding SRPBCC domain-containing protein